MIINTLLIIFAYVFIGTIVFKITYRMLNWREGNDIVSVFWPMSIPIILTFHAGVWVFDNVIDPGTDKVINTVQSKMCKTLKD